MDWIKVGEHYEAMLSDSISALTFGNGRCIIIQDGKQEEYQGVCLWDAQMYAEMYFARMNEICQFQTENPILSESFFATT